VRPPSPLRPIDLERIRVDRPDARVIDVRTPGEFAGRHIPGSYNVPLPELAEHQAELTAASTGPVVLVCESGRRAGMGEIQLADAGLGDIHVLEGGVAAWEANGLPLARLEGHDLPWTLERQVRLVAGTLVASSVAASVIFPPAAFLAGAVGAGLAVAALTDTCTMGLVLSKLPYNRRPAACDMPTVVEQLTNTTEASHAS
jgi:rhodanese-related sulfurtransferase